MNAWEIAHYIKYPPNIFPCAFLCCQWTITLDESSVFLIGTYVFPKGSSSTYLKMLCKSSDSSLEGGLLYPKLSWALIQFLSSYPRKLQASAFRGSDSIEISIFGQEYAFFDLLLAAIMKIASAIWVKSVPYFW